MPRHAKPRVPRATTPAPGAAAAATAVAGLLASLAGCGTPRGASGGNPGATAAGGGTPAPAYELWALGRVRGTVAPCGCTTEPLGGLGYARALLGERATVLDVGSSLFPDPAEPEAPKDDAGWAQAARRAQILASQLAGLGSRLVAGVGPSDVASPAGVRALQDHGLPRVLGNAGAGVLGGAAPLPARTIVALPREDGAGPALRLGVTAVVDPTVPGAAALGDLKDPLASVKEQVAALDAEGAQLTVAIVHGPRALAEMIANAVDGLDFVIVGYVRGTEAQRLGAPASLLGDTFVLEPGEQLQTLTRVRLQLTEATASTKALPPVQEWLLETPRATLEQDLARLDARLEKFAADPAAEPGFVERLRSERDALRRRIAEPVPPSPAHSTADGGVRVLIEQVKVTCHGSVHEGAAAAVAQYDGWVTQENAKRFAGVRPPAAAAGAASYVGVEECDTCHSDEVAHWRGTRHAQAWATLVAGRKDLDVACVGCHITGFRRPGGSEVVEHAGLEAVQCEVCHGPGSTHAAEPERAGRPHAIERHVTQDVCAGCHTPEHSDTFQFEAYLRDIVGPNHGRSVHARLGPGPTGHELRAAGLAKAGGACKKM